MSKVWLVTGCSRGLGREIARAVLAAGHRLVATARSPRELDFLPSSERLRTVALDVTDGASSGGASKWRLPRTRTTGEGGAPSIR
jgi:NAD(P)-dependent dehydrogenase (short-subunit alcohol dehydrogenase family)